MSASSSTTSTSLLAPIARAVHYIAARECASDDNSPRCEKPYNSPKIIGIAVGVTAAVLILGSGSLLLYLHMRRQRFERKEEDAISLEIDGEVDDHPTMGKPPRAWQPHGQRGDDNPFEADRQPHQRENPFEPERR
ncbi:hypothetical protein CH063_04943 [Colletotrichum higginsianum]|uniref:Uncharacterized protein n=2 Tax=Colletotrichum higginsianum TaxID=80884 RepID=H1UX90_COLHI|nr:hypothetical protein CH63R_02059 [Colletotrichum higginsianum IMI 349063]OBR13333.1 hypothetical protein CH63R_02059 [Colletotrichum higginsianum IMI 349063]TID02073.1 hypothetical protein CH35J_003574 [Colletotrichum higginsianum]CCF32591.1 hypothetical protein CH063_04943 [Colletotrichum higginsianum]